MTKNIIFIHIPKAAGTTFDSIIKKNLSEKNCFFLNKINPLPDIRRIKRDGRELKENTTYISGHMGFGLHQFLNKNFKYIAFFRNPVDRIISHYYYIKRSPEHYLYDEIVNNKVTLGKYVSSDYTHEISNGQIRIIASENAEDVKFDDRYKITERDFKKAKKHIENKFLFVGLKEKFNLSLIMIKKELNLKNILYYKRNVSTQKPYLKDIPEEIINIIKERNKFDIKLYEYVKKIFKKQISNYDGDIIKELNNFERKNNYFSSFVKPYFCIKNFIKKLRNKVR